MGFVDEDGLTVFETLHDMQVRSCKVFSDRELFGTYSEESNKFEWMTYAQYAEKVDTCRAFLQSVGTYERVSSCCRSPSPNLAAMRLPLTNFTPVDQQQESRSTTRSGSLATTAGSGRRWLRRFTV